MTDAKKRNEILDNTLQQVTQVRQLIVETFSTQPYACVLTYGCQQNVNDSQFVKGLLKQMGYALTEEPEAADLVIFNTCAVREHAEMRVFGNIGALKKCKKSNPDMLIAIMGCMSQQDSIAQKIKQSYPYVDIVLGTGAAHILPQAIYSKLTKHKRVFTDTLCQDIVEGLPVDRENSLRGWLPIMYGCNNFCSYCIVPYVRGRERSRKPEDILAEARELIASGAKEITLLGQNVNSYGNTEDFDTDFSDILRMINDLEGDFRISFMTSHPKDCTEKLIKTIAECPKVSRRIHLPFQSGSNRILKQMNRGYTAEKYLSLIELAKKIVPDVTFTSDIIVGFPGETEEDFEDTLKLVEQVEFLSLFTFIYSKRQGTPAAKMEDPTTDADKKERFSRLLKLQDGMAQKVNSKMVGKTVTVLCDGKGRLDSKLAGRALNDAVVEFEGDESLIGQFVKVKIDKLSTVLEGTII